MAGSSAIIELTAFDEPHKYDKNARDRVLIQKSRLLRRKIAEDARKCGARQKWYSDGKALESTPDQYDVSAVAGLAEQVILYFGAAGGSVAFLKLAKDAIMEWKGLSPRNKVKAKVGATSIEVTGTKDYEAVVSLALKAERDQKATVKRGGPPRSKKVGGTKSPQKKTVVGKK